MDIRTKEDFPIDWEEDQYVSRREFFRFMTLASGGLTVGSVAMATYSALPKAERKFEPALICRAVDVEIGASFGFSYPRPADICVAVRRSETEWVAYSRRCTHLSCPVEWEPEHDRLYCPCHNGAFSISTGEVLQGPPPHPLPKIKLEVRNDEIWAVGVFVEARHHA